MLFRKRRRSRPELRTADDLAERGQIREAIDVLTLANRQERDLTIERRLVELRFLESAGPSATPAPPEWPPETPDLFPGVELPEVQRSELTAETLRSGILHHGSLLVRGLVDPERAADLVAGIDRAIAGNDAFDAGAPATKTAPWFAPVAWNSAEARQWVRHGGGVLAVESPRVFFDIMETLDDLQISELVEAYFGEPAALLANKWTLRRVEADTGEADWHQDGSFMGTDIRSLDLWLALSPCGVDAPGLDVVARRFEDVVDTGTDGARLDWTVGPGLVERVGTELRPVFAPGDAMLFDHLYLHRTGAHAGMTRDRYALEAWFASPSHAPADQRPVLL